MKRILHCDLDCFYAAVHIRDDPKLAGLPVVVGGNPNGRGVVTAASYEARRFGIHSAMPAAWALRRCPNVVFIRPDFQRYRAESKAIFAFYREVTPLVQPVSLDEAYLDVTEHLGAHESATALAAHIREQVKEQRGLTLSIGVGPSKLVAKIASDFDKPDGLTVVPPGRVEAFLEPLPVRRLPGVGPATEKILTAMGIQTVAELRELPEADLRRRLGKSGGRLFRFAHGIDDREVEVDQERKSLGCERTYSEDLDELEAMDRELERLSQRVASDLGKRDLTAHTLTLKLRYSDFTTISRSRSLAAATDDAGQISACVRSLLRSTDADKRPVRLLGVTGSRLVEGGFRQLSLFGGSTR